jgi:hypothetical protein
MGHEHEEGDACTSAEQDSGSSDVEQAEEVGPGHHLFSTTQ